MRPEFNSRRLFGITRSKGKMYELGLPEQQHIAVPPNDKPQELFGLTVGTLGDVAADLSSADVESTEIPAGEADRDLDFAASFFDAFLASRFSESIARDVMLLAASAYYLANRPGSSLVLARQLNDIEGEPIVDRLLRWVLQSKWESYPAGSHPVFGEALSEVARQLAFHFYNGSGAEQVELALKAIRKQAYKAASARDLLFIDIIAAIIRKRLASSAWKTLPRFTGLDVTSWASVIQRPEFPRELWPSQLLIGKSGLFLGEPGVIQMPTSAGKTRSVEIVLRSGFLSGRTKLAVIVAPFRALCHEIGMSLHHAFRADDVKVNELSDALQIDFLDQIAELLGTTAPSSKYVLVLTPEKLLYVLRQAPSLVKHIGMVVYDEGHQFDSGSRGITYELLLTEIKALLPPAAQTVLVSAVIQNAEAVGQWLIGPRAKIVNGAGLLPTARSVAFASWVDVLGQLLFYESEEYDRYDYFVPRVIEQQKLDRHRSDKKDRFFPEKRDSKDVSLYLGIRLASQGAVAIFCGRKDTASGLAARAVEIYERGFALHPPSTFSNTDELCRLKKLINGHFGEGAVFSRAASLGVFVHHANTPHGLRLSVEYAMQRGLIKLVACTSTLAQGVNLPIRYLIVSSVYQAGERIKVRDFQNLIGRAGRAGMHTEGLVVFADPNVYDRRLSERWRFETSVELLSPSKSENTTSSLLSVLAPFKDSEGHPLLSISPEVLCGLILSDEKSWAEWAAEVVRINPAYKFDADGLVKELKWRRHLVISVESYLMANRGEDTYEEFKARVEKLAASTLAYHLASDEIKPALVTFFASLAAYIETQEPNPQRQRIYSKTLLSVRSAKEIEQWVNENREFLLSLTSNEDWLSAVWSLFSTQIESKFFYAVEPSTLPIQLAGRWIEGANYLELANLARAAKGTMPWGTSKRRRLTEDDIINFCEGILSFDCSLVVAAVTQFLFGGDGQHRDEARPLGLFQKSMKYGLPDRISISAYEHGFADRVLAQKLRDRIAGAGYIGSAFTLALSSHRQVVAAALADYPTYFESVLDGFAANQQ